MALSELYDPGKGFIVNDTCIIEADVDIVDDKVVVVEHPLDMPVHYNQVSLFL